MKVADQFLAGFLHVAVDEPEQPQSGEQDDRALGRLVAGNGAQSSGRLVRGKS
jgi:hypothetical protein